MAVALDRYDGVEPDASVVAGALREQRDRMAALFRTFDHDQWNASSRCSEWTIHEVARHLVDVATLETELFRGGPPRTEGGRIDPRRDPSAWLESSRGQPTGETVAAFDAVTVDEQAAYTERLHLANAGCLPGPYGELHWSTLGAHLFWDAWLHERDIVLALDLPHQSSAAEDRLAALYGLAISSIAPTFFGTPVAFSVELSGSAPGVYVVEATPDASARVHLSGAGEAATVRAELGPFLDALAGRGGAISDVVDAPAEVVEPLTILRSFLLPEG